MAKRKVVVEHCQNSRLDASLFDQPSFKKFLGSQFVSNFLYILGTLGFEIRRPRISRWNRFQELFRKKGERGSSGDSPGIALVIYQRLRGDNIEEWGKNALERDMKNGIIWHQYFPLPIP